MQGVEMLEDRIEAHAADVLHDEVRVAVLLADAEHGHDVGVVEACGGAGFALEAFAPGGAAEIQVGQHLDGDAPAEGFLLGLIDDAHAAVAEFADDAEITKPLDGGPDDGAGRPRRGHRPLGLLDLTDGREEVANVVGQLRMLRGVCLDGGLLAAPAALRELIGECLERIALCIVGVHHGLNDCRLPIADFRLGESRSSRVQSEIGNRQSTIVYGLAIDVASRIPFKRRSART